MNWSRMVFGRRGRDLGASRWPLLALGGGALAVAFAYLGDWIFAAGTAAAAAVGVIGTLRRWER